MQNLFSKSGQNSLDKFLKRKNIFFAFDYDGTLTPIVRHPSQAILSEETSELLNELAKFAPVAIVSGRSRQFLKAQKFGFKPELLIGNHGIEDGQNHPSLIAARKSVRKWKGELGRQLKNSKVRIEDKTFSLSLHYRGAHRPTAVRNECLKFLHNLKPEPQIILGKCVINLLLKRAPHKGDALKKLQRQLRAKCVFYIGDDDTDEKVFERNDGIFLLFVLAPQKNPKLVFLYLASRK